MRTLRRTAMVRALVIASVLGAGAFAGTRVGAAPPNGCCGLAESGSICTLDSNWMACSTGQGGDAACYEHNHNFPHCCESGGWCGGR